MMGRAMRTVWPRKILVAITLACCTGPPLYAQHKCADRYSEEQRNLIGHAAYIGAAGRYCPNLKSQGKPLYGYLAHAWNTFSFDEFDCPLWKKSYTESENAAAHQIVAHGLKYFCENSVKLFGPTGTLLQDALQFHVPEETGSKPNSPPPRKSPQK